MTSQLYTEIYILSCVCLLFLVAQIVTSLLLVVVFEPLLAFFRVGFGAHTSGGGDGNQRRQGTALDTRIGRVFGKFLFSNLSALFQSQKSNSFY